MQNYYYERPDDANNDPERYAAVMEIGDDETVMVFNAGGSVPHAGKKLFGVGNALTQVEIGVRTAAALASRYGYAGSWTVALGVTNLSGTVDMLTSGFMPSPGRPWPRDSSAHIEATSAYTAEMLEQPGEIVRRVTLPLQRGFGVTEYYAQRFPHAHRRHRTSAVGRSVASPTVNGTLTSSYQRATCLKMMARLTLKLGRRVAAGPRGLKLPPAQLFGDRWVVATDDH